MLRREEDANFIIYAFVSDMLLTLLALYMAFLARITLPFSVPLTASDIEFGPALYVTVAAIWTLVFFLLNVYDTRHTLRATDELQTLLLAISLAAFVFAGVLYLSYRDLPRLLFFYFIIVDAVFLLSYRWTARLTAAVGRRSHAHAAANSGDRRRARGRGGGSAHPGRSLDGYRAGGLPG